MRATALVRSKDAAREWPIWVRSASKQAFRSLLYATRCALCRAAHRAIPIGRSATEPSAVLKVQAMRPTLNSRLTLSGLQAQTREGRQVALLDLGQRKRALPKVIAVFFPHGLKAMARDGEIAPVQRRLLFVPS